MNSLRRHRDLYKGTQIMGGWSPGRPNCTRLHLMTVAPQQVTFPAPETVTSFLDLCKICEQLPWTIRGLDIDSAGNNRTKEQREEPHAKFLSRDITLIRTNAAAGQNLS